jgi:DNA-binding MarR family transcriptional regulator
MNSAVPEDVGYPELQARDRLPRLLMRLGSRSFAMFGAAATECGLPPPVAMALQRLEPDRPRPMHALAGAMGCDPSYVTGIADQLEALGLAERRLATHDRRVKELALTPAGVATRERFLDRLARSPFAIDHLSGEEAAMFVALLERVLDVDGSVVSDQCGGFVVRQQSPAEPRLHRSQRRRQAAGSA